MSEDEVAATCSCWEDESFQDCWEGFARSLNLKDERSGNRPRETLEGHRKSAVKEQMRVKRVQTMAKDKETGSRTPEEERTDPA